MVDLLAALDTAAPVCVLARFDDPHVPAELGKAIKDRRLGWILTVVEQLLKLEELGVVESFLDVECQGHVVVVLLADGFVVDLHVVINGFFVAEVEVVFLFTVHDQAMRSDVGWLGVILFVFSFLASDRNLSGFGGR